MIRPTALLTLAYEGGHPDHDACSFLAFQAGRKLGIPVWEMPLYRRSELGALVHQEFISPNGTEVVLHSSEAELEKRNQIFSIYASQPDVQEFVDSAAECFRPQPEYQYSRPPTQWPTNYEVWQWPITAIEVCRAFELCSFEIGRLKPALNPDLSEKVEPPRPEAY